MEKLARYGKEKERAGEGGGESRTDPLWDDMDWDEELSAQYGDVSDRQKGEILQKIGAAGERYTLEQVKEYFWRLGYETCRETLEEIQMKRQEASEGQTDGQVRIYYRDSALYHQAGWDIQVSVREGEEMKDYYLEVKTHTPKSGLKDTLSLSGQQMRAAARHRERYTVLLVVYDPKRQAGEKLEAFTDPLELMGEGRLVSRGKRYLLFVERQKVGS